MCEAINCQTAEERFNHLKNFKSVGRTVSLQIKLRFMWKSHRLFMNDRVNCLLERIESRVIIIISPQSLVSHKYFPFNSPSNDKYQIGCVTHKYFHMHLSILDYWILQVSSVADLMRKSNQLQLRGNSKFLAFTIDFNWRLQSHVIRVNRRFD